MPESETITTDKPLSKRLSTVVRSSKGKSLIAMQALADAHEDVKGPLESPADGRRYDIDGRLIVQENKKPSVYVTKEVHAQVVNQVAELAAEFANLKVANEAVEREVKALRKELTEKVTWEQSVEKRIDEVSENEMKLRCQWVQQREQIQTELAAEALERDAERSRQHHHDLCIGSRFAQEVCQLKVRLTNAEHQMLDDQSRWSSIEEDLSKIEHAQSIIQNGFPSSCKWKVKNVERFAVPKTAGAAAESSNGHGFVSSPAFSLLTLERLQLRFYPFGSTNAEEGMSTVLLWYPKSCHFRCRLSLGEHETPELEARGGLSLRYDMPSVQRGSVEVTIKITEVLQVGSHGVDGDVLLLNGHPEVDNHKSPASQRRSRSVGAGARPQSRRSLSERVDATEQNDLLGPGAWTSDVQSEAAVADSHSESVSVPYPSGGGIAAVRAERGARNSSRSGSGGGATTQYRSLNGWSPDGSRDLGSVDHTFSELPEGTAANQDLRATSQECATSCDVAYNLLSAEEQERQSRVEDNIGIPEDVSAQTRSNVAGDCWQSVE